MMFVDVTLPLPLNALYTYALPADMEGRVEVGARVVVPFGPKKYYTAIVIRLHTDAPAEYRAKEVMAILDQAPVILPGQLKLWEWIADYYLCTLGDVYKAAIPSGLKLESETIVGQNPDFEATEPFTKRETQVWDALSTRKEQSIAQIEKSTGIRNVLNTIKSLLEKDAVFVKETLKETYRPKEEKCIRLTKTAHEERLLNAWMDEMQRRAPKQLAMLNCYLELSHEHTGETVEQVTRRKLLKASKGTQATLSTLISKGILEEYRVQIGRLATQDEEALSDLHPLSSEQQRAFDEINEQFRHKDITLLYGVTSSGKTEIYTHLIQETLKQGKQVLYLLPEIALTTQITERLQRTFGSRLGVYHSKFPDTERVEIWQKMLSATPYDIILGVRSSVFLPFTRLGLVIVDEEHEQTYKQQDPAPRYHARNAAMVMAQMQGAKVLLGTATPSIESWHHAQSGKYGLVQLLTRYREVQLPEILPVDIRELQRKRRMVGPFSPQLLQLIKTALDANEQVILFQNRRGFAPMVECHTCGWIPKCTNCDVSLTYHKGLNHLPCHYCGYTYTLPTRCPACEETDIRHRGYGTEKIEDEIQRLFPEARVARMDLDTTRTRQAFERIISDFEQGKTDILIGTQMVSKGLDFNNVNVVSILNADQMMGYPDFRAYERSYQLMAQVAGRAGRRTNRGKVILQTKNTDHPIIHQVIGNRFEEMAGDQLAERQMFHYPPFYRMIYIYLKHKNEHILEQAAMVMAGKLRGSFGPRILGPDKPPVARIQTYFIRKIVVKIEANASLAQTRQLLRNIQSEVLADKAYHTLNIYFDVDPL